MNRTPRQAERIKLIHGSLTYRDPRLANFETAAVVEVIEHLNPSLQHLDDDVLDIGDVSHSARRRARPGKA